jgi:hypothetical protein
MKHILMSRENRGVEKIAEGLMFSQSEGRFFFCPLVFLSTLSHKQQAWPSMAVSNCEPFFR